METSWTVKPLIEKVFDQLTIQDLIDTSLVEALAKLEKRVAENKIALAAQSLELQEGRLALEQHLMRVTAWNEYKAKYIADQLRAREEKLAEKRAAKRARTRSYF